MQVTISGSNMKSLKSFRLMSSRLTRKRLHEELHRGVVDAGRKTKTHVQKAVIKQMAMQSGNYQSYVVAGTRGIPRKQILAFDIFGVKGGASIEKYRGLRASGIANRLNAGRSGIDRGTVRSSVWSNPRIFKRSFESKGGYFAMLPASAGVAKGTPKALWTYGLKASQPRGAGGRFASSGVKYGKVRRLFGPSLMKEIPEDQSLATFMKVGPALLEQSVTKRMTKLMRF